MCAAGIGPETAVSAANRGTEECKIGDFFFFEVLFGLREILCGLHMV